MIRRFIQQQLRRLRQRGSLTPAAGKRADARARMLGETDIGDSETDDGAILRHRGAVGDRGQRSPQPVTLVGLIVLGKISDARRPLVAVEGR